MAWCRPSNKPLSELLMVRLPTHICVAGPQWVNLYPSGWFHWHWVNDNPDSKVHGAHLGPTGPRWDPCWPHELCSLGWLPQCQWRNSEDGNHGMWSKGYWNKHNNYVDNDLLKTCCGALCVKYLIKYFTLRWRHNKHDGISNHQPLDCLLNCLFRRRSKETSKLHITGLCERNSAVTGELPAQRVSSSETVSIWWRHHDLLIYWGLITYICQWTGSLLYHILPVTYALSCL